MKLFLSILLTASVPISCGDKSTDSTSTEVQTLHPTLNAENTVTAVILNFVQLNFLLVNMTRTKTSIQGRKGCIVNLIPNVKKNMIQLLETAVCATRDCSSELLFYLMDKLLLIEVIGFNYELHWLKIFSNQRHIVAN